MTRILLISTLFLLLVSCNDDDDSTGNDSCISYERALITEVDAPTTGTVNQPVNFEVTFQINDGCGAFDEFIETADGNLKIIEVNAKYEGCFCTQAIEMITKSYSFTPTSAGVYTIKFKSSETEFLIVDVEIY